MSYSKTRSKHDDIFISGIKNVIPYREKDNRAVALNCQNTATGILASMFRQLILGSKLTYPEYLEGIKRFTCSNPSDKSNKIAVLGAPYMSIKAFVTGLDVIGVTEFTLIGIGYRERETKPIIGYMSFSPRVNTDDETIGSRPTIDVVDEEKINVISGLLSTALEPHDYSDDFDSLMRNDGISHLNISHQPKTSRGYKLAEKYPCEIDHPTLGKFNSIEELMTLKGNNHPEPEKCLMDAIIVRALNHKEVLNATMGLSLPLDNYWLNDEFKIERPKDNRYVRVMGDCIGWLTAYAKGLTSSREYIYVEDV